MSSSVYTGKGRHAHVGVPTNSIERREKKVPFHRMKGCCGVCVHRRQISKAHKKVNGIKPISKKGQMSIWPADVKLPCESWFYCAEHQSFHGKAVCYEYCPEKIGLRKPDTEEDKQRIRQKEQEKKDAIKTMMRSTPYANYGGRA